MYIGLWEAPMLGGPSLVWRARASISSWRSTGAHWQLVSRRSYAAAVPFGNQQDFNKLRNNGTESCLLGTVRARRPQTADINALVDGLKTKKALGQDPGTLLLLLTPSFAQSAYDSNLPLRILRRLGYTEKRVKQDKTLHTLTAVIDRIPAPSGKDGGHEGLAYFLSTSSSPLQSHARSKKALQTSAQKPGSLKFELDHLKGRGKGETGTFTVQMPLAQTIFSTGQVSTLIGRNYVPDAETGELKLGSEEKLESHTIGLPLAPRPSDLRSSVSLVPLTPPRLVINAMGNIVRQLSAQRSPDVWSAVFQPGNKDVEGLMDVALPDIEAQPASTELEAAVTKYFKTLDIQPEPVQVWVLIFPKHMNKLSQGRHGRNGTKLFDITHEEIDKALLKGSQDEYYMDLLTDNGILSLVKQGARLCKVLSGGGGWGKKAGLLSFDPDSEYSTRELRQDEGWAFDFGELDEFATAGAVKDQKRQALGEIVKQGDSVMFLLAPRHELRPETNAKAIFDGVVRKEGQRALFGVLPSSIDEVPAAATDEAGETTESFRKNNTRHHEGFFGMLSEGGMALNIAVEGKEVVQTKFDVPFSRLVIRQSTDETSAESVAGESSYTRDSKPGAPYKRLSISEIEPPSKPPTLVFEEARPQDSERIQTQAEHERQAAVENGWDVDFKGQRISPKGSSKAKREAYRLRQTFRKVSAPYSDVWIGNDGTRFQKSVSSSVADRKGMSADEYFRRSSSEEAEGVESDRETARRFITGQSVGPKSGITDRGLAKRAQGQSQQRRMFTTTSSAAYYKNDKDRGMKKYMSLRLAPFDQQATQTKGVDDNK